MNIETIIMWVLSALLSIIVVLLGRFFSVQEKREEDMKSHINEHFNSTNECIKQISNKVDKISDRVGIHGERLALAENEIKGQQKAIDCLKDDKRDVYRKFSEIDHRVTTIEKSCLVRHGGEACKK